LLCLWTFYKVPQTFFVVMIMWAFGLFITFCIALLYLVPYFLGRLEISANLIRNYFKLVPIILIGTLAARALFSIDRIIVEHFFGLNAVAVYGLFVGIALAFVGILDAGILVRAYPNLVKYGIEEGRKYRKLSREVQIEVALLTMGAAGLYELFIFYVLDLIGKSNYHQYSQIGLMLIVAYGIYSMSFPLNCRFYANSKDKHITIINLLSLLPFLLSPLLINLGHQALAAVVLMSAMTHYFLRLILLNKADI
jgi:hypothetical protein